MLSQTDNHATDSAPRSAVLLGAAGTISRESSSSSTGRPAPPQQARTAASPPTSEGQPAGNSPAAGAVPWRVA